MKALTYLQLCQFKKEIGKTKDIKEQEAFLKILVNSGFKSDLDFYSQPFKPELITELFEGWKKSTDTYNWYSKPSPKGGDIVDFVCDSIVYNDNGFQFIPRTLDDFINDCQRAGIELQFKEVTK